jgi:hypothetical protein
VANYFIAAPQVRLSALKVHLLLNAQGGIWSLEIGRLEDWSLEFGILSPHHSIHFHSHCDCEITLISNLNLNTLFILILIVIVILIKLDSGNSFLE